MAHSIYLWDKFSRGLSGLVVNPRVIGGFSPAVLFANNEPGVWYDPSDLSTLFQDTAGTTPVTTPGQTVGLMLDKSKGAVDLMPNGGFDSNIDGWLLSTANVTAEWDAGRIKVTNNGEGWAYYVVTGLTVGQSYTFFGNFVTKNGGGRLLLDESSVAGSTYGGFVNAGARSAAFVALTPELYISLGDSTGGTGIVNIYDDFRIIPGFHATQATAAARPTYGIVPETGRRNLLGYTEQFNVGWTPFRATVAGNQADPNGGTNAYLLAADAQELTHVLRQTYTQSGGSYSFSVFAKYSGKRLALTLDGGVGEGAVFDLQSGSVVNDATLGNTAVITPIGDGWYRCSIYGTPVASSPTDDAFDIRVIDNASTSLTDATAGDGTSGIYIWGAQLEEGSTNTAYQKVTTAFDVTEAGVTSLGYLSFDGVDDWMVTPTITPGVDKAQVFAGVRKLSDAVAAILLETSANINNNQGSLYVTAPESTTVRYGSLGRGAATVTTGQVATITASGAAPDSAVLTATHDIAGDLSRLRRNGVAGADGTADKGTGNFLAYPMYIGSRAGTSVHFKGDIYSLITRFGANLEVAQIENTEAYVAGKTAGVDL